MKLKIHNWLFWGPVFVIIGASLWGTETYFRVHLNDHFDSDVLVFHEHLFCILFALPIFLFSKKDFKVPLSSWIYLFLSGALGSALGTALFTLSLRYLNISVANVLLNFQPVVSVFFAQLLLSEKLGKNFFLWMAGAILCGLAIAYGDFKVEEFKFNIGLVYITVTALAWGFSTVAGRGTMLHMPLAQAALGRFVVGAFTLMISLIINGKFNAASLKWSTIPHVWQYYVWLSLAVGVVPQFFYFQGLRKTSATVGGFCELTQTFTALLITWGVMGQPLTLTQSIAGIALLGCVYMINLNYARANRSSGAQIPEIRIAESEY